MRRFIKRVVLQDLSPLQLARLDVGEKKKKKNWVYSKDVNIDLGAESTLKVVLLFKKQVNNRNRKLFTVC